MVEVGGQYTRDFRRGLDYAFIADLAIGDAERLMPSNPGVLVFTPSAVLSVNL